MKNSKVAKYDLGYNCLWFAVVGYTALAISAGKIFFKMGQSLPLFVYFRYFLDTFSIIQIEKSVDGVLGIRTRGCRMVGADKTTELWRPPKTFNFGWRLMFERSCVRIRAPYTGWIFLTLICCKNCIVCLKKTKKNEKEAGDGPFKKYFLIYHVVMMTTSLHWWDICQKGGKLENRNSLKFWDEAATWKEAF